MLHTLALKWFIDFVDSWIPDYEFQKSYIALVHSRIFKILIAFTELFKISNELLGNDFVSVISSKMKGQGNSKLDKKSQIVFRYTSTHAHSFIFISYERKLFLQNIIVLK